MSFLRAAIKEKEKNEIQRQRTETTNISQEECLPSTSKFSDILLCNIDINIFSILITQLPDIRFFAQMVALSPFSYRELTVLSIDKLNHL